MQVVLKGIDRKKQIPPSCFRPLPRLASRDAEASKKRGGFVFLGKIWYNKIVGKSTIFDYNDKITMMVINNIDKIAVIAFNNRCNQYLGKC
ncbi:MAG TPA: hypothetical protein DHV62_10645 [Elusimicrobia bacterium]|nr:hypothetical protein [Elusimicrobiota bacterium]